MNPGPPAGLPERRRSPRHAVREVRGTMHISSDAKVLNMSLIGMAVQSGTAMRVGRNYAITLTNNQKHEFRLQGTVVWCRLRALKKSERGDTSPLYEAGFKFSDTLSDKADNLLRFMQESAVIALEQRVSGRFKVNLDRPVNLDTECDFVIRSISSDGVLIETEVVPEPTEMLEMEIVLDDKPLTLKGRIIHSREVEGSEARQFVQVGVEFAELGDADRKVIESYIAKKIR
jgi:hypothetical protein